MVKIVLLFRRKYKQTFPFQPHTAQLKTSSFIADKQDECDKNK